MFRFFENLVDPYQPYVEQDAPPTRLWPFLKDYIRPFKGIFAITALGVYGVVLAGDSGDGMQLVGGQFADIASMTGSAICSFPDFPSDIRAPVGTLGGVSGYQLSFGDQRVTTPGDAPFVLVAMNPAALKVCLPELQKGGIIMYPLFLCSIAALAVADGVLLVELVDDAKFRKLFDRLAEEEHGHFEILQAEKDAISGNYHWFSIGSSAEMED